MQRDLNDTLIFVKVVELETFAAAARALSLPNSTVSRKVRELEERLGARLLNRTTRRLALTEAGARYFEHGKRIASELDEAENAVQQLESSPRGWLRITAPYNLSITLLAPILRDFRARYPEVRVDLVLNNDRLDLVSNEIDVAIRPGTLPDSTLVARRLVSIPTRVYAGEDYLTRYGEPQAPEDLEHHHTLVVNKYHREPSHSWRLRKGNVEQDFPVNPVAIANDPEALLAMLIAGDGLMLTTEMDGHCVIHTSNIRQVLPEWRGPDIELNAVYVGGRVLSPRVRAFVDFAAERMQQWSTGNADAKKPLMPVVSAQTLKAAASKPQENRAGG